MTRFQTTRWSLIAAAHEQPSRACSALEQLCCAYRPPVLAFVRRSGYGANDAEDLTQAFFVHVLERGWYPDADPHRGRFRSLLLTSLRHFLADQHDQAGAAKRGGQWTATDATDQLADDRESPEQAFARAWLGTVLSRAMARLHREWERAGKQAQFEQLSPLLAGHDGAELKALAQASGLRRNTLAVQVHRMRQRLQQIVRLELLQTVGSREALEQELEELRAVLEAAP